MNNFQCLFADGRKTLNIYGSVNVQTEVIEIPFYVSYLMYHFAIIRYIYIYIYFLYIYIYIYISIFWYWMSIKTFFLRNYMELFLFFFDVSTPWSISDSFIDLSRQHWISSSSIIWSLFFHSFFFSKYRTKVIRRSLKSIFFLYIYRLSMQNQNSKI